VLYFGLVDMGRRWWLSTIIIKRESGTNLLKDLERQ
jgi:hypothetical protein